MVMTMRITVTKDVQHQKLAGYDCVLVQFEDDDAHYWANKNNWLPKDVEVLELAKTLAEYSPSFKKMLIEFVGDLK